LAQRYTGTTGRFAPDSHPWGARDFSLERVPTFGWFLTKERRNHPPLVGDVWTSLNAIDALIRGPESPWRPLVEPVWTMPIQQPDLYDTVTLWRLKRVPNRAEMEAGGKFVGPIIQGALNAE
ncbi:MAG: hypothetical protein WCI73_17920, partial [Phycisphaerae bacterium]